MMMAALSVADPRPSSVRTQHGASIRPADNRMAPIAAN